MEGNSSEENRLTMDGIGEVFQKTDGVREFPLVEIAEIQRALRPLGYMVEGFKNDQCSAEGLVVYLTPRVCLSGRKDPAFFAGY